MILDYWYVDTKLRDGVLAYVPATIHVLATGRYRTLNPVEEPLGEDVVKVVELEKREPEEKRLEPVAILYFDFDRWEVKKEERGKLRGLSPDKSYFLVGHADWIGKEGYNYRLSLRRAEETKRRMEELGFKVVGFEGRGERECLMRRGERVSRSLIRELSACRKVEIYEKEENHGMETLQERR